VRHVISTFFANTLTLGQSGTKDARPQLSELMAEVRNRTLDAVIVWRLDRFARSTRHLLLALKEFRTLGLQFINFAAQGDELSLGSLPSLSCPTESPRFPALDIIKTWRRLQASEVRSSRSLQSCFHGSVLWIIRSMPASSY
jgi:hypothetical protein